jgi:hypothetical protein
VPLTDMADLVSHLIGIGNCLASFT